MRGERATRTVGRDLCPLRRAGLVAALTVALALAACGDDGSADAGRTTAASAQSGPHGSGSPNTDASAPNAGSGTREREPGSPAKPPPPRGEPSGPAESGDRDPRQTAREREAARTMRDLVAALDARDGARVCELLAPGALGAVELPRERGGCAASLSASIGYRDPRGFPVWKGAEVTAIRSVEIRGERARVIATTATTFADRDELSIEDDITYLVRGAGEWLIAKPSSTVYRAVGIADVPPSVLAPPG